ncbi:MAG: hypothetical protein EOM50_02885 [Erysipelotrichia bacterium]|nr:hypothetical protein [Erysipelotrichia bacterium]NCC54177.1 hypothetical protein [Erysipelotrichia bacterium]
MGLFKSKNEKRNNKINKQLGYKNVSISVEKDQLKVNFYQFPLLQLQDAYMETSLYTVATDTEFGADYDFFKGYAYQDMMDNPAGWLMGVEDQSIEHKVNVIDVKLVIVSAGKHQEFLVGRFLERDENYIACQLQVQQQCDEIMALKTQLVNQKEQGQKTSIKEGNRKGEKNMNTENTLELLPGNYYEGRDYQAGIYDIKAVKGSGLFNYYENQDDDVVIHFFDAEDELSAIFMNYELKENSQLKVELGLKLELIKKG